MKGRQVYYREPRHLQRFLVTGIAILAVAVAVVVKGLVTNGFS